ncbi:hypothetical protein DK28_0211525 [Peptococcaceae bacterium SCADC1_2_3]|nr:hypothetical protein DK28_0211525 [Peptococcaceae bacterium SCADC1_2_3]KFI35146.1 hypothetical protein HY00_07010 [Peptococcaceae bacterium SCADC1_2_3]
MTLVFFNVIIWYCQGELWAFLLAGLFAGLALLTSKFSGQVLIFFSILLALFLKSPLFLVMPFLSILFALVLSKGYYYRVLVGWIKHSIFFKNVLAKNISVLTKRNNFSDFRNVLSGIIKRDFRKFAESLINIYSNNTYVILITRNVLLIILLFFGFNYFHLIIQNKLLYFLVSWIFVSIIVFFITSLKPFLFLGEAERYLEYSIPAQVILFSFYYSFLNLDSLLSILLIYHGLFYIINMVMLYLQFKISLPSINSKQELFSWFNQRNFDGKKVLAIPANYYELIYGTDCAGLYPPANFTLITKKLYESLWEEHEWHSRDIERLIKNYSIDLIVIQKQSLKSYASKKGWHYNLEPYCKIFENDFYCVYAV